MKYLPFIIAALAIFAGESAKATEAKDHLAGFHGAHGFCNLLNKLQKLPETSTACSAIIMISRSELSEAAMNLGAFGRIKGSLGLDDAERENVILFSELTLEQLEAIRFDDRILVITPDFPMGPNGSFTVRN